MQQFLGAVVFISFLQRRLLRPLMEFRRSPCPLFQYLAEIPQFLQKLFHIHYGKALRFQDSSLKLYELCRRICLFLYFSFRWHFYMGSLGLTYCTDPSHFLLFFFSSSSQFIHDLAVKFCVEQLSEDHLFFI